MLNFLFSIFYLLFFTSYGHIIPKKFYELFYITYPFWCIIFIYVSFYAMYETIKLTFLNFYIKIKGLGFGIVCAVLDIK